MNGLENLTKEELISLVQQLYETTLRQAETIKALEARVAELEAEVEMLRSMLSGGGSASSALPFVKPNRKERREAERKARKKRDGSHCRGRDIPTETVAHELSVCPDCGGKLKGGWVAKTRQVIDIPPVRVRVREHQVIAKRCCVCGRVASPRLDLSGEVVGQSRFGIGLMGLICELWTVCRLPIEQIKGLLKGLFGLEISKGGIVGVLQRAAGKLKWIYDDLGDEIRGSPVVNADETGWRQDGENGYLWSFSTPRARYFVRDKSRSSDIPRAVLGQGWRGRLVCDFYSAYGCLDIVCQRCWVHLLRDLKKLKDKYPQDESVTAWVDRVADIYRRAREFSSNIPRHRTRAKMTLERMLMSLAEPYLGKKKPQSTLAGRIEKHLAELFVFVEEPAVPSDNNAAERSVRPAVIARKISGGTRSALGSETRMILMSIFGTWKLRGLGTLDTARQMLAQPNENATTGI